ncbi:hypothetical protein [Haloarchaeobius amylolyticus]|uniref:hypothetical protein n=1 Tax=Haloarchaeobius amylolyticus TaxID=1198296 RepID=UPI00226E9D88|nr:hypothetical protein [Haloarchaeobius amylolyticus]
MATASTEAVRDAIQTRSRLGANFGVFDCFTPKLAVSARSRSVRETTDDLPTVGGSSSGSVTYRP